MVFEMRISESHFLFSKVYHLLCAPLTLFLSLNSFLVLDVMSKFSVMSGCSTVARKQYHLNCTPHFNSLLIPISVSFLKDKQTSLTCLKVVGSWFVELVCWEESLDFLLLLKLNKNTI